MTQEIHTPVTAEEIGHEFEGHAPTANISDYAIEDWITHHDVEREAAVVRAGTGPRDLPPTPEPAVA